MSPALNLLKNERPMTTIPNDDQMGELVKQVPRDTLANLGVSHEKLVTGDMVSGGSQARTMEYATGPFTSFSSPISLTTKRKHGEMEAEGNLNKIPPPPNRPISSSTISSFFHSWPRFLVIHSPNTKLTSISPFLFYKGIQGIAGDPKQLTALSSGDFLIEVNKESHSKNLLKATSIGNISIQITPHKTLNSCKGMIKCPALNPCSEEEILENLQSQGVTKVRRLVIRKDNNEIQTSIHFRICTSRSSRKTYNSISQSTCSTLFFKSFTLL